MFRRTFQVVVFVVIVMCCQSFRFPFFPSDKAPESYAELCKQCSCLPQDLSNGILDCSRRNVDSLPEGIIFPTNLNIVIINGNSLKTIGPDTFSSGSNVLHLDLSSNQIDFVADGAFKNLEYLKSLDLSNNKIWSLSDQVFEKQSHLEILDLSNNKIQDFFDSTLESLKNLKSLNLNSNPLFNLQREIFWYLSNLRELHLERTGLRVLPDDLFKFNGKLTILKLKANFLKDVPTTSLETATKLEHLDLSENPIEEIKPKAFKMLESLTVLKINNMDKLETIGRNAFHGVKNLKELQCSFNSLLTAVHPEAFRRNDTGEEVHVQKIYLRHNRLETMRYSMLNWDILEDIDVSGNPWQCDCRLQWLFRMHLPRKVKDTIRCHFPQKLQGRSVSSLKEQDFVCGLELRVDLIIIFGLMTFVLFVVTFASCSYVLYKRNFCLKPRSHMQQQYTRIKSNKHSVDLEWDYSADP